MGERDGGAGTLRSKPIRRIAEANHGSRSEDTQTNGRRSATFLMARAAMQKNGVNSPCWCGSGQKLKKCHGRGSSSGTQGSPFAALFDLSGKAPSVGRSVPSASQAMTSAEEPDQNGYAHSRHIPEAVMRQLRQEAGFGCIKCGHPYVEYHHIVPFAEESHHRPEDMMALCGNCHPEVSKYGRDRQRVIKERPFNVKRGAFLGALAFDKRDLVFRLGSNWYDNTPVLLQFFNTPIVSCRLDDGQAKVSLNLLSPSGQSLLRVDDNEISFRINDLWDFEYAHNTAVARYGLRDIALRMDFRSAEATIEGKIWLGRQQVRLGRNETILGSSTFSNSRFSNCRVGIQIGDASIPIRRPAA
jgi:5-methylcytosine-specific restriction endonuclease McrA